MSLIPANRPDLIATFMSVSDCMDRTRSGVVVHEPVAVEARSRSAKQLVRNVTGKNRERDAAIIEEWIGGKTAEECAEGRNLTVSGISYILRRDMSYDERIRIGAQHRARSGRRWAERMKVRHASRRGL